MPVIGYIKMQRVLRVRPYQYGKKSWNSIGPYKVHAPISSILMKPRDVNSL